MINFLSFACRLYMKIIICENSTLYPQMLCSDSLKKIELTLKFVLIIL